jgi:2C-methyl-D-erythritol 2,4-cyclodiphosphate synthase
VTRLGARHCDALLGAGSLGDIGTHFPDTDPKWKTPAA